MSAIVDLQPNLAFNISYPSDLISSIFMSMVHSTFHINCLSLIPSMANVVCVCVWTEVLRRKRPYLPMFNEPEWEEVLMCNRGSDPWPDGMTALPVPRWWHICVQWSSTNTMLIHCWGSFWCMKLQKMPFTEGSLVGDETEDTDGCLGVWLWCKR